ncbi:MAG: Xaa-Pro aminopeptidase [Saprospiraceae bacterium]|jgi:Xaa-Pro aminopeptidase
MKYAPINPDLFRLNRRRFTSQMKSGSIAIFHSNDLMPRNGDQFHPFRQNSSLFSLCGLDQEQTVLVLFPGCVKEGFHEIVFTKKTDNYIATWEGHKYTKEEAKAVSGIEKIYWLDEMDIILHELILLAQRIYVNNNENDRNITEVPSKDLRFTQYLQTHYPAHKYHRSQPILRNMAMIKSKYEIELIQEACTITEKAFLRVLEFVRPGTMEYEVEAEIIHEFLRNRATGHAYQPVVASGKNSCILHYGDNNQACKNGDILLLDFGAEYANYAADLTRSIPVNGQFTARQKGVYNSVLNVIREATQMLLPGVIMEEYHKEVGKMMESELLQLGLLDKTDIKNQNKDYPAYKKYFMHGTSHHLGLDVHDLSNRYAPIQAGMVFTVEPGIYIPEENLGIRIENDILVTDHGPFDLMENIPIEAEAIEEIMNAKVLS